ncbi:UDPGP type 1 family protein [Myxococcota bacterium]|nr:UDPGP type 1 family protein [Myxococcota bacterium]
MTAPRATGKTRISETEHSEIEPLRQRFGEIGQGHVFGLWNDLTNEERVQLAAQAGQLDLDDLQRRRESVINPSPPGSDETIEPASAVTLEELGDRERKRLANLGEEMLRAGRIGVMVVAGGQGTRLGWDGPKGGFPIGPVTDRCLFEIQAQRLLNLRKRYDVALPWYVMTSAATHTATEALFTDREWFGIPPEDVRFFEQGSVPSLDLSGRLMLERPGRIFVNPDGHGGTLTALLRTGTLDAMEQRGIDRIFFYQVDNPLVNIADPVFLGLHETSEAEMSCKVIRKLEPMEKVGIVARVDGRVGMVEYTELGDEERYARDPNGDLRFWTGNVAIHILNTDFVRRVASDPERWLPYHASMKKIPYVDSDGKFQEPAEPNGHKFERFVFDALPAAHQVCILEADRTREYAPVKNASGGESPESARNKLSQEYRRWLGEAGVALPDTDALIEIDHSRINGADDAAALQIRSIEQAPDAIRTSPGARS